MVKINEMHVIDDNHILQERMVKLKYTGLTGLP